MNQLSAKDGLLRPTFSFALSNHLSGFVDSPELP